MTVINNKQKINKQIKQKMKYMKKIFLITIVSVLVYSCNLDNKAKLEKLKNQHDEIAEQIKSLEKIVAKEEGKSIEKVANVSVADVAKTEFNHYLEVQGKIDGEENVAVSPKMMGVVTAIFVSEGQSVKKGQALAQLDDAIYRQSLASLDSTRVFVNNIYIKQKNLWDQNIGSELQYLTAKNNLESIDNNIKSIKEQLKMLTITSPIDGTIEELPIKVGQSLTPGLSMAFRVVNLSKVKVLAEVAEAYSSKIKTGTQVNVFFPDLEKEITSRISFSSKYINPINRTFTCEVRLDNNDESYRANMIAVMKINDYHTDSTITVPVNLIQKIGEDNYVFIAEKNKDKYVAKKVKVTTGQSYNGYTEIIEGLKAGDKMISAGFQNIEEGQILKF